MKIPAWSYSRLSVFERCPYQLKLQVVDKAEQGFSEAANRGVEVHTAMEKFIKKERDDLIPELQNFKDELENLRTRYEQGQVDVEQNWAFDNKWQMVDDWMADNVWCRVKLDAMVSLSTHKAVVIDLKTGRKSGNEIKHVDQGQLYTAAACLRYQNLREVVVEFWYVDQDDISTITYTAEDAAKFILRFEQRGLKLTEATEFPPKPSIFTCRICPYRQMSVGGNGKCTFAVSANRFVRSTIKKRYF